METVKIVNYIEKRIKDCRAHKYEIKELSHTDIVTIGDDEYVLDIKYTKLGTKAKGLDYNTGGRDLVIRGKRITDESLKESEDE